MKINVDITIHGEIQIKQTMLGKKREHVIKKRNSSLNFSGTVTIQIDA
jgi:hypothetical protein